MRFLVNARHSGANSTLRLDSDKQIADLLNAVKRIAVLGVSARPERPSHQVFQFLLEQGYDAIPVNPQLAGETLLGKPVLESISAATAEGPVDMVDVFRDSRFLPEVTQNVLRLGIKALW
ncbi:MAG: CoA-binding protein, partial [Halieaceae bacterium]